MAEVQTAIKNAYSEFRNVPYWLQGILIHDGEANSGHYYSFVYDRKQDVWWRFNDHTVELEDEKTVMSEAIGSEGSKKTAYCLIYGNDYIKA